MLFNSPVYGVFLFVTYVAFWGLRRRSTLRPLFLTAASYLFYFVGTYESAKEQEVPLGPLGWTILCVAIIFVGSSLDYYIGRKLGRTESPGARKALLLVSVVYYLGVLSVFKYFNFAIDSFATVMGWAGLHVSPTHLRLVLPFGISFFTFETMSYTIDVYRRETKACHRYLDYLLFVCFFPHLVAGPIVRPKSMLPQLRAEPVATETMKAEGLFQIATGLCKKIIIATRSASTSSTVFSTTPSATRRSRCSSRCTRMPSRSTRTSPATRTSRSEVPSSSGTSCRRTSTCRTCRAASRSSGTAGTSRSRRGSATTCTSRSAATAARRGGPTAT